MRATADCDDNLCSEACYQHGGAAGGQCDDKDQCICNRAHKATFLFNQMPGGDQSMTIPAPDQL